MVDNAPEEAGPAPDPGRAKRAPPTIDLEATEVSTQPQPVADEAWPEPQPEPEQERTDQEGPQPPPETEPEPARAAAPISPWVIGPFSGAAAAALVIAVGWMLGWPAVQAPPAAPQVNAATVEALSGRLANLEARLSTPAAPAADPATTARVDGIEKSLGVLRDDVAGLRTQSDKLAAALNEAKPAAAEAAPAPDLSVINERIAQLERASRAERAELVQQGEKIAEAKPVDDMPLRRVVAASLLDVAVRHGDGYAALLATAKSLAPDSSVLKPLDEFASSGVPSPAMLSRELLNMVPKLAPPAEAPSGGAGIVDRLQAGAAKLVRIERTDAVGNNRGAVVARITAAALRNDFAEARRELKTMAPADRGPAQAWLDKVDARDAALAASRQFADIAMADLGKPAQ
jgi:hypothetical protein